jgi:hypothetical protein
VSQQKSLEADQNRLASDNHARLIPLRGAFTDDVEVVAYLQRRAAANDLFAHRSLDVIARQDIAPVERAWEKRVARNMPPLVWYEWSRAARGAAPEWRRFSRVCDTTPLARDRGAGYRTLQLPRVARHRRASRSDQRRRLSNLRRESAGPHVQARRSGDHGRHKGQAVRQAIRSARAKLFFLPNTRPI